MFITRTLTLDLPEKEIKEQAHQMFDDYGVYIHESSIEECIKRLIEDNIDQRVYDSDEIQEWYDCLTEEQCHELKNQIIQYFKEYAIAQVEETIKFLSE